MIRSGVVSFPCGLPFGLSVGYMAMMRITASSERFPGCMTQRRDIREPRSEKRDVRNPVMVVKEAEADAHVVDKWGGDGDGKSDAEGGVCDGERDDVAVVEEEQAGEETPEKRDGREDGVGQVCEGEDDCCGECGEAW